MTWNGEWQTVQPSRGKRQRLDLLSILARLPANAEHGLQELLDASHSEQKSGTTIVLVTPRDVQLGLQDTARGSMLVIGPNQPQTEKWFRFPPNLDFGTRCRPSSSRRYKCAGESEEVSLKRCTRSANFDRPCTP